MSKSRFGGFSVVDKIHVGRKDILGFCQQTMGVTSWRTIVRWKKLGFPIRYFAQGKPYILEHEVFHFALKCDQWQR